LEEEIKQIERKKLVFQQESNIAHDLAVKYRDDLEVHKSIMSQQQ